MDETKFPISAVKNEIFDSFQENQITIISTPTSSGKSMLVPYYAFQYTAKQVYCTVPRRILATEGMRSSNDIHGENFAGYIHGEGEENIDSSVCYITEGSFIMRDIASNVPNDSIICFDEVHEQGKILETLLYAAIDYAKKGLKIILMSATLDIPKYKGYYEKRGISVGVVKLEGSERMFDLEYDIIDSPEKSVMIAAKNGGRVLVGLSGKEEIDRFSYEVSKGFKGKIFHIHGEVELEEQEEALAYEGSCVYICTNMVQSGITIKGLTHGYFDGYGKRIQLEKGENKLVRYRLSKSEMKQWYGRLGRVCHGVIFVKSQKDIDLDDRDEMPTPEILRTSLEDSILFFAYIGLRMIDCVLLNKPPKAHILLGLQMLKKLKCADENGDINSYGLSVVSEGQGVRGGIAVIDGRNKGIENLAKKVALVSQYRPFLNKNGDISTSTEYIEEILGEDYDRCKHSDILLQIKIVEYFIRKYCVINERKRGYVVVEESSEEFKKECEKASFFRRTLQNVIYNFYDIDKESEDVLDGFEYINDVIKEMYADCITDAYHGKVFDGKNFRKIGTSSKAIQLVQMNAVGNFVCIEDSKKKTVYLIENVTYL